MLPTPTAGFPPTRKQDQTSTHLNPSRQFHCPQHLKAQTNKPQLLFTHPTSPLKSPPTKNTQNRQHTQKLQGKTQQTSNEKHKESQPPYFLEKKPVSCLKTSHPPKENTSSTPPLRCSEEVQATDFAFAALLRDGRCVSWGDEDFGGSCSPAVQVGWEDILGLQKYHFTFFLVQIWGFLEWKPQFFHFLLGVPLVLLELLDKDSNNSYICYIYFMLITGLFLGLAGIFPAFAAPRRSSPRCSRSNRRARPSQRWRAMARWSPGDIPSSVSRFWLQSFFFCFFNGFFVFFWFLGIFWSQHFLRPS